MAFAAGDRCRTRLTSAALGLLSRVQPQPPRLAVVTRAAGGPLIFATYENGQTLGAGVVDTVLDKLTEVPAPTKTAFLDKMVVGTDANGNEFSAEFIGQIVDLYTVQPGATGATTDRGLIKTASGLFYEMVLTQVLVLGNR
jgi:hypothetical protein